MGWLIAFGILILLAILPVGASVIYNSDGFFARVVIGPLKILLFPSKSKKPEKKEKQTKKKTQKKTAENQSKTQKSKPSEKKDGGSITDFLPFVNLALDFLGDFRRKLRVNTLEMKLIMAGDDPCDLALNYGKAWTALGNLMPLLEKVLVIRKRNLEVECDFTASQTVIYARVDITITIGRILALVFGYGARAVVEYFKIVNKRKGGANV